MERPGTYSQLLEAEFHVVVTSPMWVPGLALLWASLNSQGLGETVWGVDTFTVLVLWSLYGLASMFVPLCLQGFVLVVQRRSRYESYAADLLRTLGLAVEGPLFAGTSFMSTLFVLLALYRDSF